MLDYRRWPAGVGEAGRWPAGVGEAGRLIPACYRNTVLDNALYLDTVAILRKRWAYSPEKKTG